MKFNRILSTLLAVLMLLSAGTMLVGAAESTPTEEYTYNTGNGKSPMATNMAGIYSDPFLYKEGKYLLEDGTEAVIQTAEDKLKLMDYRYGNDSYKLYVDAYSGEIAVQSRKTGEILFSNPYNIANSKATNETNSTKDMLLSQLIVNFTTIATDEETTYNSYYWAACRNQIIVKNIKGGIRVEYSIGREESKSLVPKQISEHALQKKLFSVIEKAIEWDTVVFDAQGDPIFDEASPYKDDQFEYTKFQSFYTKKDPNAPGISATERQQILTDYPVTEKFPIRVLALDPATQEKQIKRLETLVKKYCKDYTFEEMNADHEEAGYEATNEIYPLFKMALEYTLDEDGLVARLPANGIRFDETVYRLNDVQILPFMGAGTNPNKGYNFFPDGSGTLFDFQTIANIGTKKEFTGKIYGDDYAYHEIEGKLMEVLRYPVFGVAETQNLVRNIYDDKTGELIRQEEYTEDRGFVAIVEEGDSLMKLTSYHGGTESEYNSIKISVDPRPTDSYNLQDAISVGDNTEWTVVSARKYTGSYKIRYIMLSDEAIAAKNGVTDFYECSYVGMAKAYREYLESIGVLSRLTAEDVEENLPLYIETFGALTTTKKILSIPVEVMAPLTSFKDITTIYDELAAEGINNINFVMKGYTKGGLEGESVPYYLKWEKAVEKEMDFDELLAYAREKGFGVFPDFDFVFADQNRMFDGLSLKKHAAKTIDNRYTSKREYSATRHTYTSFFELALSSAYFSHFYEKFIPKYQETNPMGISVSTLGSYLNSDFDEDEPYNRADSQGFTAKALDYIKTNLADSEVLTSGGNAYSWKYVDHITDIALDSSRVDFSAAAVPFLGMVLHGYVEIAGEAFNTEGNLDYAFLKTLESGASLKFLLSYQNTAALKEYEMTSKYYSIRYDIWRDDVIATYNELNALLKGVQTSTIVKHEFVDGIRVADDSELNADILKAVQDAIRYEEELKLAASEAERKQILEARTLIMQGIEALMLAADEDILGTTEDRKLIGKSILALKDEVEAILTTDLPASVTTWRDKVINNPKNSRPTDINKVLNEAYARAYYLSQQVEVVEVVYQLMEEALDYLNAAPSFKDEYYAELEAMFTDATFAALAAELRGAKAEVEQMIETAEASIIPSIDDLKTTGVLDDKTHASVIRALNTYEAYVETMEEAEGENTVIDSIVQDNASDNLVFGTDTSARYEATAYTIVHQAYDNGTELLLNFNDYRVVVEINGMNYTIEAYGYVVLNMGA